MRVRFDSLYKAHFCTCKQGFEACLSSTGLKQMQDKLVGPVKKKERVNLKFKIEGSQS